LGEKANKHQDRKFQFVGVIKTVFSLHIKTFLIQFKLRQKKEFFCVSF
jgi:hypothetical protein